MSVTVELHPYLTGGRDARLEVEGATVGECLQAAAELYPELAGRLYARPGELKGYVEVLINSKPAGRRELEVAVLPGDRLSLLVFLSGG